MTLTFSVFGCKQISELRNKIALFWGGVGESVSVEFGSTCTRYVGPGGIELLLFKDPGVVVITSKDHFNMFFDTLRRINAWTERK